MSRLEIAITLERLAKMVRDGDETTIEMEEAREAIDALGLLENYQDELERKVRERWTN